MRPRGGRGVRPQLGAEGGHAVEAVIAAVVARPKQQPVRFNIVLELDFYLPDGRSDPALPESDGGLASKRRPCSGRRKRVRPPACLVRPVAQA